MRWIFLAAVLFLALPSVARADDVGCVSTTFNLLDRKSVV